MYSKYIKKILDILAAILAIPFFLISYLIFGLLIKLEDNGPVFYKAERIGKDRKVFRMYKFRSMVRNAPNIMNPDGSTYNSKNDPRVTKVGRFMRESSIDEIPQIINVLKGEMSIVGPRACLVDDLPSYKKDEIDKINVLPGITGYNQAFFRNSLSNRQKRLNDAWYANNLSFALDVKIFLRSIITVAKRENIYTND
jgi:lipopolysaccharide/colanic/teichoic acid biosynthesis glycosyltransferase